MEIHEHNVPHASKIPLTNGLQHPAGTTLHVVEFDGTTLFRGYRPVLMLHGRTVPGLPVFDLRGSDGQPYDDGSGSYSWARHLMTAGYDVFVMDLEGYGGSYRPDVMNDPCNTSATVSSGVPAPPTDRRKLKDSDFPGGVRCADSVPPKYGTPLGGFLLNTTDSDVAAVETVVNDLILAGADPDIKVRLVGYSAAAQTLVPFMLKDKNWEKVSSLFLCSPVYPPDIPNVSDPTPTQWPKVIPPLGSCLNLYNKVDQFSDWDKENPLPSDQRTAGIADAAWQAMMALDATGKAWGTDGLLRWPGLHPRWGFNDASLAANNHDDTNRAIIGDQVPVLILYGSIDSIVTKDAGLGGLPPKLDVRRLISALPDTRKIAVRVDRSGHYIPWEKHRKDLHKICQDWLDSDGKVHWSEFIGVGHGFELKHEEDAGRFYVYDSGAFLPEGYHTADPFGRLWEWWNPRKRKFWLGAAGAGLLAVLLRQRRTHPEVDQAPNADRLGGLRHGVSPVAIGRLRKLADDLDGHQTRVSPGAIGRLRKLADDLDGHQTRVSSVAIERLRKLADDLHLPQRFQRQLTRRG